MCGILIYRKDYLPPFDINHRGIKVIEHIQDDWKYIHSSLPLQTANTNLSQPIIYPNGNILLFNGEIFNANKISKHTSDLSYLKDLFQKGFKKRILTESNKWDGFWAIVFYEKSKNKFFAFTDPLGKKQLYYSKKGICSEIKPLIEKGEYFFFSDITLGTSTTMFENIQRMLPNKLYILKARNLLNKEVISNCYAIKKDKDISLYSLLNEAVKDRLVNKIDNITIFVSGGLDSTIILHHLLENYPKEKIQFLSIDNEENKYIKILENYYDIHIERIEISNIEEEIQNIVRAYETPLDYGSLIPQWYLTKYSKNRVILTGDGADELFSGYNRALTKDTYYYDVFLELPYLHHIRLDRISMHYTKELRNPFLAKDVLSYSYSLSWQERKGKSILKEIYKDYIPEEIILRDKQPLRYKQDKALNKDYIYENYIKIFNKYSKQIKIKSNGKIRT